MKRTVIFERKNKKGSAFYSCLIPVHPAQLGSKTTAINYLQALYGHLRWFIGLFMEMHNTDRSSSGYRRPTELSRTPKKETDELKETKSSPHPKKQQKTFISFNVH